MQTRKQEDAIKKLQNIYKQEIKREMQSRNLRSPDKEVPKYF